MTDVINKAKAGYREAVDWIAANPQKAGWGAVAAIVLVLVIR
ncbi:hypothetical protein [Bradyrhizobium sp. LHD-71]|nr:hypothetical protein [Bradyrhizobium sp. LHD-71]MDQ8730493.1 hypothetical protein [Bradyrhizobium sp. LHD-71]